MFLLLIIPAALWAYVAGGSFIGHIPTITTPLSFLMGIVLCCTLLLAIGIALGITTGDKAHQLMNKIRNSTALASFLSLFGELQCLCRNDGISPFRDLPAHVFLLLLLRLGFVHFAGHIDKVGV